MTLLATLLNEVQHEVCDLKVLLLACIIDMLSYLKRFWDVPLEELVVHCVDHLNMIVRISNRGTAEVSDFS
jgi:hypothetical protein